MGLIGAAGFLLQGEPTPPAAFAKQALEDLSVSAGTQFRVVAITASPLPPTTAQRSVILRPYYFPVLQQMKYRLKLCVSPKQLFQCVDELHVMRDEPVSRPKPFDSLVHQLVDQRVAMAQQCPGGLKVFPSGRRRRFLP